MTNTGKHWKIKYLYIALVLFFLGLIVRLISAGLYLAYDFLIISALYFLAFFTINPRGKKSVVAFIFVILAIGGIYTLLPILQTGIVLLTNGKIPGGSSSAYKFIPCKMHILLVAIWASSLFVCFTNKIKIRKAAIVLFAALHLLVYLGFDTSLKGIRYNIDLPNIEAPDNPIVIAHISDLHSSIYPDEQEYLIEKIKAGNPDLILLTGDIADDYTDFKGTELLLKGLADYYAPVYYVTGNHEYWDENFLGINERIKSYGVIHLEDKYEIIEVNGVEIMICGIDDPDKYLHYKDDIGFGERLDDLNDSVNFDGPKILLSHRPEKAELYKSSNFDITLSGHAHGGQVRIPFLLNGLYAPNQGLFPKYAGGLYELDNDKYLLVSRGLYIDSLPRIFNPPELVWVVVE